MAMYVNSKCFLPTWHLILQVYFFSGLRSNDLFMTKVSICLAFNQTNTTKTLLYFVQMQVTTRLPYKNKNISGSKISYLKKSIFNRFNSSADFGSEKVKFIQPTYLNIYMCSSINFQTFHNLQIFLVCHLQNNENFNSMKTSPPPRL